MPVGPATAIGSLTHDLAIAQGSEAMKTRAKVVTTRSAAQDDLRRLAVDSAFCIGLRVGFLGTLILSRPHGGSGRRVPHILPKVWGWRLRLRCAVPATDDLAAYRYVARHPNCRPRATPDGPGRIVVRYLSGDRPTKFHARHTKITRSAQPA